MKKAVNGLKKEQGVKTEQFYLERKVGSEVQEVKSEIIFSYPNNLNRFRPINASIVDAMHRPPIQMRNVWFRSKTQCCSHL